MTTDLATVPEALRPIEPIAAHMVASTDGTRLHVREWGRRDAQDDRLRPRLVAVRPVLGASGARSARGALPPHHVRSARTRPVRRARPTPARYSDDRVWADDLAAVLDAVSAQRPVLVGWSYGAFVIADYLRAYGEDGIGAIALVGASMRLTPPYDGIGPGLLENVVDMCGADLLANIEATRRFLAACTRRPRTPAETEIALAWNMTVPARGPRSAARP